MSGEREDAGSSRLQPTPVAPSRGGEGEREHTSLSAHALLDQAIALLHAAQIGGWEIAADIQGDFRGTDLFALKMWRRPPTPQPHDPQVPDDRSRDAVETKPGDLT